MNDDSPVTSTPVLAPQKKTYVSPYSKQSTGQDRGVASGSHGARTSFVAGTTRASPPNSGYAVLDFVAGDAMDRSGRNAMPSTLKGKSDASKGKFAVMNIHVQKDGEAAAQRSSLETVKAAQVIMDKHREGRKRKYVDDSVDSGSITTTAPVVVPALVSAATPTVRAMPASPSPLQRSQPSTASPVYPPQVYYAHGPWSADRLKGEQKRLMTLLKTLKPEQVVEQLHSALFWFGGPSESATFIPESAEGNGTGSMFVRWLGEIFPKVNRIGDPPVKRRGRPPGAKNRNGIGEATRKQEADRSHARTTSTPVRRETRAKFRSNEESQSANGGNGVESDGGGWEDVGDRSNSDDEAGQEDIDVQPARPRLRPRTQSTNYDITEDQESQGSRSEEEIEHQLRRHLLAAAEADDGRLAPTKYAKRSGIATAARSRIGRPKGSKNRPKATVSSSTELRPIQSSSGYKEMKEKEEMKEMKDLIDRTQEGLAVLLGVEKVDLSNPNLALTILQKRKGEDQVSVQASEPPTKRRNIYTSADSERTESPEAVVRMTNPVGATVLASTAQDGEFAIQNEISTRRAPEVIPSAAPKRGRPKGSTDKKKRVRRRLNAEPRTRADTPSNDMRPEPAVLSNSALFDPIMERGHSHQSKKKQLAFSEHGPEIPEIATPPSTQPPTLPTPSSTTTTKQPSRGKRVSHNPEESLDTASARHTNEEITTSTMGTPDISSPPLAYSPPFPTQVQYKYPPQVAAHKNKRNPQPAHNMLQPSSMQQTRRPSHNDPVAHQAQQQSPQQPQSQPQYQQEANAQLSSTRGGWWGGSDLF